jgi:hypothetical protein
MGIKRCGVVLVLVAGIIGCKSGDRDAQTNVSSSSTAATPVAAPSVTSPTSTPLVKGKIDPCKLLTGDDLKSVQGEAPTQSERSDRSQGGFTVAQCYYLLPTTTNSVVLNVTTAAEGSNSRNPRDYWKQTFASQDKTKDRDREAKERKGEEEESAKPERVTGLGEDAYWSASRVGGALYVLQKDIFFRISVGGAGDAKSKLTKSKTLARKVLQRL